MSKKQNKIKKRSFEEKLLIKHIYLEKQKIERKLNNIIKGGYNTPAYEKYMFLEDKNKKGKRYYDASTRGKSEYQLRITLNRLINFQSLSYTNVKGAKVFDKHYKEINQVLNFDDNQKTKFFDIYDRFVEGKWLDERMRYSVWGGVIEMQEKGFSKSKILKTLEDLWEVYHDTPNKNPSININGRGKKKDKITLYIKE